MIDSIYQDTNGSVYHLLLSLIIIIIIVRWSEALHGIAVSPGIHLGGNVIFKFYAFFYSPLSLPLSLSLSQLTCATSFPQVITTASSFNK